VRGDVMCGDANSVSGHHAKGETLTESQMELQFAERCRHDSHSSWAFEVGRLSYARP